MKILHIIPEEKFIPHLQRVSRAGNPGQNMIRIDRPGGGTSKFAMPGSDTSCADGYFENGEQMKSELSWCDALFVHYMTLRSAKVIAAAPQNVRVVWCGWGGDYYGFSPKYRGKMILPQTQALIPSSWRSYVDRLIRIKPTGTSLPRIARKLMAGNWMRDIAPRIDYFCVKEHDLNIKEILPGFRAKILPHFGYYSVEGAFETGLQETPGPDILLGNSATHTNNHIDAFDILRKLDIGARRVVLPLSYPTSAKSQKYAQQIEDRARQLFGNNVHSLRQWMPIEEYNRTIASCGTIVMNHIRGQAMGNICAGLYKGAKIYLRSTNPYFGYLKDKGAEIFALDRLGEIENFFNPLPDLSQSKNREAMIRLWSFEAAVDRVRSIVTLVEADR